MTSGFTVSNRIVATGAECSSSVVLFLHYSFWCLVTANVLYKYVYDDRVTVVTSLL